MEGHHAGEVTTAPADGAAGAVVTSPDGSIVAVAATVVVPRPEAGLTTIGTELAGGQQLRTCGVDGVREG
jgi:hypothetical protein